MTSSPASRLPSDVQLLTRAGCTRTALMHARLSAALATLGLAADVEMVDLDALPSGDARRGFGTPTILVTGRDLFPIATASSSPTVT